MSTHPDMRGEVRYLPDIHRLLPQSPDAEQGVIGSFLLSPREVGGLCIERGVYPASFHIPSHGQIFAVLMEFWNAVTPIDFITLTKVLRDRNKLDQVGGAAFVTELFTFIPTAANASYYIDILLEKETLRRIITVGTEYAARSYDEQDMVPELLAEFEKEVFAIRQQSAGTRVTTKEAVMEAVEHIEKLYEARGSIMGLPTGFHDLDQLIDGMHAEDMIVIAARPSMGKTALAMNIADHVAIDLRKAVGIFSLEMSQQQLMQRMLCSRARVNLQRVRSGFLGERDFPNLTAAASKIVECRMIMDDAAGTTIQRARAVARRWKTEHDVALIIIDYLQLMRSGTARAQANRQQEVSEVSAGIKEMARELKIPIVVLAQLNRESEREKRPPRVSDLRDSGSIEQDADTIALLDREETRATDPEEKQRLEGRATLNIAKQRNGPTGEIDMTFLKEFTRFEDRAQMEMNV